MPKANWKNWRINDTKRPQDLTTKQLVEEHALLHLMWHRLGFQAAGQRHKMFKDPEYKRFVGHRPWIHIRAEMIHREMAKRDIDCVYKLMTLGHGGHYYSKYWEETYANPKQPDEVKPGWGTP